VRRYLLSLAIVLAFFAIVLQPTKAQTPIVVSIGTPGGNFLNGHTVGAGAFNSKVGLPSPPGLNQPAPFNAFCGADTVSNCSASWTFPNIVPSSYPIGGATLTLGILDIDSAAPGDQVASFTLDGTYILTGLLNAASEGLNGGTGAPNSQYDILTITIPQSDLSALTTGPATFALTLEGPGLAVPTILNPTGHTRFNGAGLDFSTLDITPTPELTSWMSVLTGMLFVGIKLILSKSA